MLYSTLGRQSFVASLVVALFAGLNIFWMPIVSGQTSASGSLSVGAVVINSCNVNRTLATKLQQSPNSNPPLECWQPSNRQNNAVKPEVRLINEEGQQRRVLVVY